MASSLTSPQLVNAADKAIIAARHSLSTARLFATDFTADAVAPGTTLKVPLFSGTAASFSAENDYENVDGSVTYASITFNQHPKSTFEFTDVDFTLVNGSRFWDNAGAAAGEAVADAIDSAICGLINKTNISAEQVLTTANISLKTIAALRANIETAGAKAKKTILLLNPTNFAALLGCLTADVYGDKSAIAEGMIPNLLGFKAVVQANLSTDSGEKLNGALIPADALAVAGRVVPVLSPNAYEEVGTMTDEDSGLTLGLRRHGAAKTGSNFLNVEALFGAALVQPTKCIRIVSASTAG